MWLIFFFLRMVPVSLCLSASSELALRLGRMLSVEGACSRVPWWSVERTRTPSSCCQLVRSTGSNLNLQLVFLCPAVSECNLLSRVWLFATPSMVVHQALLSMGFSRQEDWSGLPFPSPGDLPDPGIKPGSPALQVDQLACSWCQLSRGSVVRGQTP